MTRDPFRIEGPACISFSGGRTSGYMLWRILQAHGGRLPSDVVVCFANTGKEMPETLDFVQECSDRWSVPITWLEYRHRSADPMFAVVDRASASQAGEPFSAVIQHRSRLPSPVIRFCTVEMKILTIARYLWSLGWSEFDVAVGLRADEPSRLAKVRANPSGGTRGLTRILPLADGRVTAQDVAAFWRSQPFDLRLPTSNGKTMHGNCDLCHLKSANQVLSLIREQPARALWWVAQERAIGKTFRDDRPSYAEMHRMATEHGELFAWGDEAIEDCACTD
jgi:3'-phosphoadenosine 5'-phosphosulfate sulfotransferase (PAPS reductase)/FAD synthetase